MLVDLHHTYCATLHDDSAPLSPLSLLASRPALAPPCASSPSATFISCSAFARGSSVCASAASTGAPASEWHPAVTHVIGRRRGDSAHDPWRDGVRRWGWGRAGRGPCGARWGSACPPGPRVEPRPSGITTGASGPLVYSAASPQRCVLAGVAADTLVNLANSKVRPPGFMTDARLELCPQKLGAGSAGLRSEVRLLCIPALARRRIESCCAISNFSPFAHPPPSPILPFLCLGLPHDFCPCSFLPPTPISTPFFTSSLSSPHPLFLHLIPLLDFFPYLLPATLPP